MKDSLPSTWTIWPVPDPDVFGDKVYSWKFIFAINLPIVLAFYALVVFSPLRVWTGVDPVILAIGCAIQLVVFGSVIAYGYRRVHPSLREVLTYGGNLAAALSFPMSTDKPLPILWVMFLLIVFFEAFGNPKAVSAFVMTLAAPWVSVLAHMAPEHASEKVLLAALMTPIGAAIYLLVAYVAGWTREGALSKADRARVLGAQEERARIEHSLDRTLGSALSEISLWHDVALASNVVAAQAASVEKAQERAKAALTDLRALVTGIEAQPANMSGLAVEIQRRAGNMCAAAGIGFDFKIESLGNLKLNDAYNAAMIAIEAVHNALTHAKPTRVAVTLSANPLGVLVEDDGIGFDPATARRGRGLRDLSDLANALGAPLVVDSAPGKGTRISVRAAKPA